VMHKGAAGPARAISRSCHASATQHPFQTLKSGHRGGHVHGLLRLCSAVNVPLPTHRHRIAWKSKRI
jgi:hypothetical protein